MTIGKIKNANEGNLRTMHRLIKSFFVVVAAVVVVAGQ